MRRRVASRRVAPTVRYTRADDGHVSGDEVVAVELAADEAAQLGDEMLDADHASGAIFALREQVAIHLVHYVANRLHPPAHTHTHLSLIHISEPTRPY